MSFRVKLTTGILLTCFSIFLLVVSILFIKYPSEFNSYAVYIGYMGAVFSILGLISIWTISLNIDEEKIQLKALFLLIRIEQTIYWKEIDRVSINYLVNPTFLTTLTLEAPNYTNYGFKKATHHKMELMLNMFNTEFLEKLLLRISDDTETYLNPILINRFVRRYGKNSVQTFDNIEESMMESIPSEGIFTVKFFMSYLRVYVICLAGFFIYNRFWGHILGGEKELVGSLVFAFFGSLTYYIYWWLFGGNASS